MSKLKPTIRRSYGSTVTILAQHDIRIKYPVAMIGSINKEYKQNNILLREIIVPFNVCNVINQR